MGKLKGKVKTSSKSSLGGKIVKGAASLLGAKKGGGRRRRRNSPQYWANKVLVEKLKKRYYKLKFGGAR